MDLAQLLDLLGPDADLMRLLAVVTTLPVLMGLVIESAPTVGIPSVIGSSGRPRSGRVIHYNGGALAWGSHANCRAQVRQMHSYHRSRGWAGIGYHLLICWHGIVLTGRGINRIGAHAPGANSTHIGIQFILGGNQKPSAKQLAAFVALMAWLAARGVRASITGHRDWISTSCPGDHLYGRVRSGNWGGGSSPAPAPTFSYWDVAGLQVPTGDPWLLRGMTGTPVLRLQKALLKWRPSLLPGYGADGRFGGETEAAVEALQRARGITIDRVYGPESAKELRRALTASDPAPDPTPAPKPFPLARGHWFGPPAADDRNHSGYYWSSDRPHIKDIQGKVGASQDGRYGSKTKAAVTAWQREVGFIGRDVDGLTGPKTWGKMFG
ncbi:N-acetylmuramoyl-L-alanine amidase [Nocardiopsis sp. YSL2]|uniref:peptidoglycan recognition protein family protein n=1 Tax=Nocardiopsis sp. YSL2 TaxID=2939492 RepID=UPI0026F4639F|nr:N-acetylmuramoyl-L-alanine amidase [Nocardiopsis sp. YSL2]